MREIDEGFRFDDVLRAHSKIVALKLAGGAVAEEAELAGGNRSRMRSRSAAPMVGSTPCL
jgi:hypothetical protein